MIDREKTINALRDIADYFRACLKNAASNGAGARRYKIYVEAAEEAAELLKAQAPRVLTLEDVEQRTGRWETVYGDHISAGHRPWAVCCSECGMIGGRTRYCSNCGAKMEQNDETD